MIPRAHRALILLVLGGCIVGLVLGEASLRLFERARSRSAELTTDPVLGRKMPAGAPGHDERGYRNAKALTRADIVVLGDSQTWGVNAALDEAWPQQLARITGLSVYNVSQGGFGTLHYAALFDLARELRPHTVIVSVYLGNDLYDTYRLAYQKQHWAKLRLALPGLEHDTLEPRASALWEEQQAEQNRFGRDDPQLWGQWLQGHTAVGRLMEKAGWLRTDAWHNAGAAWANSHPDHGSVCETPVRTVLTTAYRLVAVDAVDIRIQEGVRLSLWAFDSLKRDAAASGIRLLVVLIPTKERAHADAMAARGALNGVYARLVEQEDERRTELQAYLQQHGIEALDLLPAMSKQISTAHPLYPTTTESHPSPTGYAFIANAVSRALDR